MYEPEGELVRAQMPYAVEGIVIDAHSVEAMLSDRRMRHIVHRAERILFIQIRHIANRTIISAKYF